VGCVLAGGPLGWASICSFAAYVVAFFQLVRIYVVVRAKAPGGPREQRSPDEFLNQLRFIAGGERHIAVGGRGQVSLRAQRHCLSLHNCDLRRRAFESMHQKNELRFRADHARKHA